MNIYLPIAEVSVNAFILLGLGGGVGFLSGIFGVGGGFLMTPLLIFIGIPPAVAVATEANQIVASSFSGTLSNLRRKTVDIKMGLVLLLGGLVGSAIGVQLFSGLRAIGQVDLVVALCYVVFLGLVGMLLMLITIVAASIGTPSIPGGGVVVMAAILQGIGVPSEGIVLIIGVERILGMFRTAINVTGDLTACTVFDRWSRNQPQASDQSDLPPHHLQPTQAP